MHQPTANLNDQYLHVANDESTAPIDMGENFWAELAQGAYPHLEKGRLMVAAHFTSDWQMWERHPAGEEVVLLLTGSATVVLDEETGTREVTLSQPGDYVLVPRGVWHTARIQTPTQVLFLTPGAGTEHRPLLSAV